VLTLAFWTGCACGALCGALAGAVVTLAVIAALDQRAVEMEAL